MSTPAEIIAARIAANAGKSHQEDLPYESDSENSIDGTPSLTTSIPSLNDEAAFPALGGKKTVSPVVPTTTSWAANSIKSSASVTGKFKPSTIQDAFSLDIDDHLNVTKAEFNKILASIKSETKTNIERAIDDYSKKRTYVISGKPQDVKQAKRLVVKKLTKPVKISFQVPSKLRYKIVGPQGKTLKSILSEDEVKIDLGRDEEVLDGDESNDDIFNKVITVAIEGDVEGCKLSKARILEIVKDETKNVSIKLPIDDIVKPFAAVYLDSLISEEFPELDILVPEYNSAKNHINIVGERESALQAKETINSKLATLSNKIVIDEVSIPKLKHQFLPIESILEEEHVLIQLPGAGETAVKFVGEKAKIPAAKERARQTTSQYKVEVLDMSKAHKGNLKHVKAVAQFLNDQGFFTAIGKKYSLVINAPTKLELSGKSINSIPIEIIVQSAEQADENVKAAKKEIVSQVNKLSPDLTLRIDDIDEFLLNKAPEAIAKVSEDNNVSYVILDGAITVFSNSTPAVEESEDFDFEETVESNEAFDVVNKALDPLRELKSQLDSIVLEVPGSSQQFISGPDGTTLSAILSEVEKNSVQVKLGFDGESEATDKALIYGLKAQVSTVKKLIEQAIKDGQEHGAKFTTEVSTPSSVVSRLIGKGGQFLNSLRDEFGVKIDVPQESTSQDSKIDITISGIKRNVEACRSKVISLTKRWADETTARAKIESQYHRRIVGAGGKYVNRLQEKYGVRIRFPNAQELASNSPDAPKHKDEVTIRGPSKAVASAKDELEELYKFEKANGFEEIVKVPVKAVARVIGKDGETINDISDGTGVEFRFSRDSAAEEKTGSVEVKLIGSKTALKEAIAKINDIIDEVENFVTIDLEVDSKYHKDIVGPGGSKMKEIISAAGGDDLPKFKYNRLLTIPNIGSGSNLINSKGPKDIVNKIIAQIDALVDLKKASIEESIEVPKEKQRLIVGPSGSIRQELEKNYNVSIEVPRVNEKSTSVKVVGLPENVEKFKVKLADIIKDDWNVSLDVPEQYHVLVSERGLIFRTLKSKYNVEVSHGNFTKKVAKLSNAAIPSPPSDQLPVEGETTKFIIASLEKDEESSAVIPWRLKGDEKDTETVLKLLQNRLDNAKASDYSGWFYSVKPSGFSKIIGPQGSTINSIREKSNTFITVPRLGDSKSQFAYFVGTQENLEKAKNLIEKLT